jgi:hypothetical protein
MIPTAIDYIGEAARRTPSKEFPGLKGMYIWTTGTICGAASVHFSLSTATMLAMGAMVQNLAICTIATTCFAIWKARLRNTN